jgi:hypothetical protein
MKRVIAGVSFLAVLGGTLALSKADDLKILAQAGRKAKTQITNVLPETRRMTEPLMAFRLGDALPIEERVRTRIHTDSSMTNADLTVLPTEKKNEVKIRGTVQNSAQKQRAIDLAKTTT